MTLAGYVFGSFMVLASVFYFTNQPLPKERTSAHRTWWERFSQWALQPRPEPPYSKLPLFGVAPDLILRTSHSIRGAGFHRRYRLRVEVKPEREDLPLEGCWIAAEWSMGREVFVDQWLLHRTSPVTWTVSEPPPDLEAPSYSPTAQPFSLVAKVSLANSTAPITIDIPDLAPRYQRPQLEDKYSTLRIPPPRVTFQCPSDDRAGGALVARVEGVSGRFQELELCVPVGTPHLWINYSTYGTIVLSLLYLLYHIQKA